MGVAHSSGRAETVHSLDISPALHNELEQLAVKQQKMEEQQALEAHFAQVADAPHLQRKTQAGAGGRRSSKALRIN